MFKVGDIVRFLYDSKETAMVIGFGSEDVYSDSGREVLATTKEGKVIKFQFNNRDWIVVDHVDFAEIIKRIEEAKEA